MENVIVKVALAMLISGSFYKKMSSMHHSMAPPQLSSNYLCHPCFDHIHLQNLTTKASENDGNVIHLQVFQLCIG